MLLAPADAKNYRGILDSIRAEEIEELDLGGFFNEAVEKLKARGERRPRSDRSSDRNSGRSRDRSKSGERRPRGRSRPEREAPQASAPAEETQSVASFDAAPVDAAPAPGNRPPRHNAPQQRGERRENVKGFGSDVPAFMVR
jgi:hypothetical protein